MIRASPSPPYSVAALVAAAVAGTCGAAALAVGSGTVDSLDPSTVYVFAIVVCPTALAVVAMALLRYRRSRPEGLLVWSFGIAALAAPGVWFLVSFSWWLVQVALHAS